MLSLAKFIKKEIELRENLVGTGFIYPPDEKDEFNNRVTVMGEIVSTAGFNAEKQYVFYEVMVPEEGGWTFEDTNEYETQGTMPEESSEYNKRKSCTQVSAATVEPSDEDPEDTQLVSHFSFPFDFQFLAMQDTCASKRPYLLFQVNSVDDWNRHRIEGYGFLRLPIEPGYHELEVETWRPRGSLMSEIHSFFLGGSVRVMRIEELVRTKHFDESGRADIVNRFGLETEDAGRVRVNLNVCWQSKAYHRK